MRIWEPTYLPVCVAVVLLAAGAIAYGQDAPLRESSDSRFVAVAVSEDNGEALVRIYDNRAGKYLDSDLVKLKNAPNIGEKVTVDGVSVTYVGIQETGGSSGQVAEPPVGPTAPQNLSFFSSSQPSSLPVQTAFTPAQQAGFEPSNYPSQPPPASRAPVSGGMINPDSLGRFDNVPKNSPLRKAIIRGLRAPIYKNNLKLSDENPANISFVFRHFIADDNKGQAVVVIEDITGNLATKSPMPAIASLVKHEGRWINTTVIPIAAIPEAMKQTMISGGLPREFFSW